MSEAMAEHATVSPSEPVRELEAAILLKKLKEKAAAEVMPKAMPSELPLDGIKLEPDLFQQRGTSEKHISDLVRAIKLFDVLEPLTVIRVGGDIYLIDGHHRYEAYRIAEKTSGIPVRYFGGTLDEAVLESGKANSRAKLPMTSLERQNYAWRLVLMGLYSKADTAAAAGVSSSQVATMRKVKRQLGADAADHPLWWQAFNVSKGESAAIMSNEAIEEWKQAQADQYADRLQKEFGNKLSTNPEIAAMALAAYFGRKLNDLHQELAGFVDEPDDEDEDSDF
ncbi:ParB domain protein nuclease [Methylobacterium sp. 4-46]|uniref:ParB/RepB/Spo0J family partition protein n=1 Tax=unclassified Methylobacterium TaxID=2615210 RepID=UPI000165C885|nr:MULTISPECIES: ParB/RepB/Spo0J family partition protein [Methylobacterium]ACA15368.1 ParB domain protein nuclease [Methylobacterium sp. 4-46]WFT81090.1 ParB/RepB/Spo0J family partition protein [Methylobacterium nodulans]